MRARKNSDYDPIGGGAEGSAPSPAKRPADSDVPKWQRPLLGPWGSPLALLSIQAVACAVAFLSGSYGIGLVGGFAATGAIGYVALTHVIKSDGAWFGQLLGTSVLGIIAAFLGAWSFAQVGALRGGDIVDDVSVSDLAQYSDATGWRFRDGAPRADLGGVYLSSSGSSTRGRTSQVPYVIAPLVPEDWTPDQPVPAWVACQHGCDGDWRQPWRAGLRWTVDLGLYEKAMEAALKGNGLRTADGAPILEWVEDPEGARRDKLLWAAGAVGVVWLIYGIARLWLFIRRPRVMPSATRT